MEMVSFPKRVITNNRYVKQTWDGIRMVRHGKRVSKNDPLDSESRRIYVKHGTISLAKHLKAKNGWTLTETVNFMKRIGVMTGKQR